MKIIKFYIRRLLSLFHKVNMSFYFIFRKVSPALASQWRELGISSLENEKTDIIHRSNNTDIPIGFYTPNTLTKYRAATFSTKEPETLKWIDTYGTREGILFDIGANVGLYSIYHAVSKGAVTYAFEPSVFNLKLLVKNCNLNKCQDKVYIISNPLSADNSFAHFNLQNTTEGGALSSFGVDYGHDGKKLDTEVSYQTLGFSLDYLVEHNIIKERPTMIKIDVDGIEHLILKGAEKTLADSRCRTVLIEVNDAFLELSSEVERILTGTGFVLSEKRSGDAELMEPGSNFTYNQIWIKSV